MKTPTHHPLRIAVNTLALFGIAALIANNASAQLPLPIYEPIPASYTNGAADETISVPATNAPATLPGRRIGNGTTTTVWSFGGTPGGGSCLAIGGENTLSYPGLFQTPGSIGLFIRTNGTTANRSRAMLFPAVNSGTLYASFLMNIQTSPTNNRLFTTLDTVTTGTGGNSIAGVWLTSTNTLGISKSTAAAPDGTATTTPLGAGTHLVVLRYTWNAGTDDDEVALWVDPPGGSLNAPEGSVPGANLSVITGTDIASLSSFHIRHPQGGQVPAGIYLDEFRVATTWANVTSTQALCTAASIATQPVDRTVNEGIGGSFAVIAGGTSPVFQWQISTNGGTSWNNVSGGIGQTAATYQTPATTPGNNGNKFRVIVSVTCGGGSSVTSAPVTLTVVNGAVTPNGVVVDDVFQDGGYNNGTYGISNSIWFAGVNDTLDANSGLSMLGLVPASSVNWIGYYTDNSITNLPVHLDVGRALKSSLVFKGSQVTSNGGSLRIGFFDYADGATRLTANGFGNNVSAANVRGYLVNVNYGTNFTGNPITIFARQNLAATDLMGTTGDYLQLGAGPANLNNQPAFQEGVNYTFQLTVARTSATNCDVTCSITGGGSNWTHTVSDSTYAYPRFDTVGFRAPNAAQSAVTLEFTRLLVEVAASAPNPIPLTITQSGADVTLTWSNPAFSLQASSGVTGTYTNITGATSPHVISAGEAHKFFRLAYP